MAKKMLIDATHAEETRVVVVDGNKVEEFDFESENKRQLAGNIYLAKVTRVEPSLQAAFIDYGGNRHGFLAFSEIHPDYYQIPVADREALLKEELEYAKQQEEEEDREKPKRSRRRRSSSSSSSRGRSASVAADASNDDAVETKEVAPASDDLSGEAPAGVKGMDVVEPEASEADALIADTHEPVEEGTSPAFAVAETPVEEPSEDEASDDDASEDRSGEDQSDDDQDNDDQDNESSDDRSEGDEDDDAETAAEKDDSIESVADDDTAEEVRRVRKPRPRRYKIQEVVKVRQILLVQVVKEERGNKGAALTTYLSLAGRYCVLMPNTARGGGISRKITNIADRKKLKEIAQEIDVPQGAGLIVRTAGAQRTKTEIKRDYDYLKRLWEQIREFTLKSTAPAKIYEEGDLIKRSIRDLYSKEIDEVIVEGEGGYRIAKDFMRMIMPTHAKNVVNYKEQLPLFARYQVETYLGSMFNPTVQLKSGGYIVIDWTEALVAVDVNSGRATKEGSIEETALKTNLEAAEEVARQARLRDLAGLIVIDFIDMEDRRNNAAVEKRLKDKLKTDRARIQVGRISGFGLLEMSRQRLRPGMLEATTQPCHHCHGTGLIRSDDNMALTILRQLEEEGTRKRSREVLLKAPVAVINYLVNYKREAIALIESRYGMAVRLEADPFMISPDFSIEKFKTATRVIKPETSNVISASAALMSEIDDEADAVDVDAGDVTDETADEAQADAAATDETGDDEQKPKKRRRRRRRRRKSGDEDDNGENGSDAQSESEGEGEAAQAAPSDVAAQADGTDAPTDEKPKRKRTRSRSRKSGATAEVTATEATTTSDEAPETAQDADTAAPAEAEKPKRTRSRSKKAAPAVEGDPVAEASAEEAPKPKRKRRTKAEIEADKAAKAAGTDAKAEAAPKPKRKRRTKAEIEADKAAKAAAAEAATDAAPAQDAVVAEVAAPAEAAKVEAPVAAEPVPAPTPEPAPVAEEKPKPKRKGWWSLG
ncbi:Rne/Rng family ribonuclease [Celeribacter sp.]|uniref:Rne/Rng family ribonuclease n=1 Tax=Celeribacter sp. TaxID=1890673 RepID=UPI003A93C618